VRPSIRAMCGPMARAHGFGVGAALVRIVGAPLAPEVDYASAGAARLRRPAGHLSQALQARPRLDRRRVNRKVLCRQELLRLRAPHHLVEEAACHVRLDEARAAGRSWTCRARATPGSCPRTRGRADCHRTVRLKRGASGRVPRDQELALQEPFGGIDRRPASPICTWSGGNFWQRRRPTDAAPERPISGDASAAQPKRTPRPHVRARMTGTAELLARQSIGYPIFGVIDEKKLGRTRCLLVER
jgi:hypothetical protein